MEIVEPVPVSFAPTFGNKRLRMMEMDPKLLEEVLKHGSVKIKGAQEEEAVLCTDKTTYQIRFLEYSNSQLLLDPETAGEGAATVKKCTVVGQTAGYYELKEARPKLLKVGELLSQHLYSGPDSQKGLEFEKLEEDVQASREEIKAELARTGALEAGGRWFQFDAAYKADIMDSILDLVVEHDWPLAAVPCAECVKAVAAVDDNFSAEAARLCLQELSADAAAEATTLALDEKRVCYFRAKQLLEAKAKTGLSGYELEEFKEAWSNKVPNGMEPHIDMLRGLALLEEAGQRTTLKMLTLEQLPHDTVSRFRLLFGMRSKWTREDLQPYLEGLAEPGQTDDQLLLRNTRVIQPMLGKPKLYAPR